MYNNVALDHIKLNGRIVELYFHAKITDAFNKTTDNINFMFGRIKKTTDIIGRLDDTVKS